MPDSRIISLSEPDLCDYLCWVVWRDKAYCPRCGASKIVRRSFKDYYCTGCKYNFSPRSLTPFKGTRIFLKKWILYIYIYLENPEISKYDFKKLAKIKYSQLVDDIFNQLIDILKVPENRIFFNEVFMDFDKYLKYLDKVGKSIIYDHVLMDKKKDIKEDIKEYWIKASVLEKQSKETSNHCLYFLMIEINDYKIKCILNRKNWRLIPNINGSEFIFLCDIVFTYKNIQVLIKNYKKISHKDIINNDDFFELCRYYDIDLRGYKNE